MFEFFPDNYRWSYNTLLGFSGGAQLGDIALILPALQNSAGDDETWHREWSRLGNILERRANGASSNQTASEDLFLATLYHILSESFIPPSDPRRLAAYGHVLKTFARANSLASSPLERVEIPYESVTLPGYFQSALNGKGPRPTVILICGLESTKEVWYLRARQQLALRGLHCLFLDTPGTGEALRYRKLVTRHDFERPVSAALDWLSTRPDVDSSQFGIIGSSLGGYYVARAAAFEPRLKAAAAWGAINDFHSLWEKRLRGGGTIQAAPSFQLMFITGTETLADAVDYIRDFKVALFANRIECPFLIMHGENDRQVSIQDAHAMFDAIGSKHKELKTFSGEDGGSAHCQFDNHLPALHFVADWISGKLGALDGK